MKTIKNRICLALLLVFALMICSIPGRQTVLAAESTSWIRGTNLPAIWYDTQSYNALTNIKNGGFNTVRIVWQTNGTASRLNEFLNRCDQLSLKPIVELHDATGGTTTSSLNTCVNYWTRSDVITVMKNHPTAWLNIANEWGPESSTVWRDGYISAVKSIRNAGFGGAIIIDAGGWGQDQNDILWYASDVMKADTKGNCIFSIHMYGAWNDNSKIDNFLSTCKSYGIPIIVGEFGYNYNSGNNNLGCKVDVAHLISYCKSNNIGFIAWSWSGNDSANSWLDMTTNFGSYTWWGNYIKNNMW
jgi:mannan endo-1,4-beta-mannosidase